MRRWGRWLTLALLLCVAVCIVSAPLSSLAYIAANSNIVRNSFNVVYLPAQAISVPVIIQKSMLCLGKAEIGPGGFEFYLLNTETGDVLAATSDDNGWATIYVPFTMDDVGKTYHYRLYELDTQRANVVYDTKIYDISISISLDEIHELKTTLTVDGEPVEVILATYVNLSYGDYVSGLAPLPETGDEAQIMLWLAMLAIGGAGLIILRKRNTIFRRLQ